LENRPIDILQMDPSLWQSLSRPVAPGNLNCDAGRYLPRFSADPHELGLARPLTALFSFIKAHLSRRAARRGKSAAAFDYADYTITI
jgi:hypothetical protein